ncbi:MAG TPA: hypothetical protein PKM73_09155 [Verrucomicrobiota bacterium]|nr:hypothetical protein [Verrucomicrobiota bacterium]HNU51973.1 hypothetical protein [Verrucomicrobiota bacterium]
MKRRLWVVGLLVIGLLVSARAEPPAHSPNVPQPSAAVELAQAVSMITGVAISPLLGVGAVGAWKYLKAPPEHRAALPWFAQPWFWIPALLLVSVVFAKDAIGPAVPTALKKPFDLAEVFENKISALVATGAFVPLIISVFPDAVGPQGALATPDAFASIPWGSVWNTLLVPFAMAAFLVVWLAAHAINILILVSPFATVDAALKGFRMAILSTVTLTAFADPYWGAAWALVVIVIAYALAGWSLRLTVMGSVFAWDLVTGRRHQPERETAEHWAFLARRIGKAPIRSYGRLRRHEDGTLVFRYRPWLLGFERTLSLPGTRHAVGRGFLSPELLQIEGDTTLPAMRFPPRYRSHEEYLERLYGGEGLRDIGVMALWRWIRELFLGPPRTETAPQPG